MEVVWKEAARLYANRSGMRVRRSWLSGVGERVGFDRLGTVTRRPVAKRVNERLGGLSDADMRVFHAYATVNLEQASGALRLSLIVNVSLPVGLILLLNALLPDGLAGLHVVRTASDAGWLYWTISLSLLLAVVAALVWYCYAGVHQARDLYHLSSIELARRGLAGAALSDQNPMEARL